MKIQTTIYAFIFTGFLSLMAFMPLHAADVCPSNTEPTSSGICLPTDRPTTELISEDDTIGDVIVKIINILLSLCFLVAVIFVIWGGYQYLTSGGSEDGSKKGKQTLVNAAIGVALIVLAYAIVNIIAKTVQEGSTGIQ